MKELTHDFGAKIDRTEGMARRNGGFFKENHIIVPTEVHTGNRYILPNNPDITALLTDEDVLFKLRNLKNDFIDIYLNLYDGDSNKYR